MTLNSLRLKFTLALLLTSLLSVALVSVISRQMLFSRFNQIAMEQNFQDFCSDVRNYVSTYGSWDAAERAEPFPRFVQRNHRGNPGSAGGNTGENFRFMLIDTQGRVLMGPPDQRGRMAPPELRAGSEAIDVNGRTIGYAARAGNPVYTQQDRQYLAAVQEALIRGIIAATVLALALGLVIGTGLSSKLTELTNAVQAMSSGNLRQTVAVKSDDEIGVLAHAFNQMSGELAQATENLQLSHAQISQQAAQLKEIAVRDGLTKLYNRRHFDEQLGHLFAQAIRYNRPLTVMIGDIDFFKRINDGFSHATGDEVLKRVALILSGAVRQSDIVARYGGEEFVIAFPETQLTQAAALCERLRQMIEAHPWYEIHADLKVTMSMGLNNDPALGGPEKMIAAADKLLYAAKEGGRNRVCAPLPKQIPPGAPRIA